MISPMQDELTKAIATDLGIQDLSQKEQQDLEALREQLTRYASKYN